MLVHQRVQPQKSLVFRATNASLKTVPVTRGADGHRLQRLGRDLRPSRRRGLRRPRSEQRGQRPVGLQRGRPVTWRLATVWSTEITNIDVETNGFHRKTIYLNGFFHIYVSLPKGKSMQFRSSVKILEGITAKMQRSGGSINIFTCLRFAKMCWNMIAGSRHGLRLISGKHQPPSEIWFIASTID